MKITGFVRVIKGQEVLQDGNTLDQHGIIDGSTVNIVIEPEKEISIKMKLGPKEFTHKVKSSVRVRDLKHQLIDGGTVGFLLEDLTLIVSADDNDCVTDDIPLEDDSLPLYLYGVSDNMTVKIMGEKITIVLVTYFGGHYRRSLPKNMTIDVLKQEIQSVDSFFGEYYQDQRKGIWLFVKRGESYRKLPDAAPISSVLSNNDVVYFIEDRFFNESPHNTSLLQWWGDGPSWVDCRVWWRQRRHGVERQVTTPGAARLPCRQCWCKKWARDFMSKWSEKCIY